MNTLDEIKKEVESSLNRLSAEDLYKLSIEHGLNIVPRDINKVNLYFAMEFADHIAYRGFKRVLSDNPDELDYWFDGKQKQTIGELMNFFIEVKNIKKHI